MFQFRSATSTPTISSSSRLDFASKNLTSVTTIPTPPHLAREILTSGHAILTSPAPGWPLLARPSWMPELSFPLEVKFRITDANHHEGVTAFHRNRILYRQLVESEFRGAQDYIAWWISPDGLWAITIDEDEESFSDFWARRIRPSIQESERLWRRRRSDPTTSAAVILLNDPPPYVTESAQTGLTVPEAPPGMGRRRSGPRRLDSAFQERLEMEDRYEKARIYGGYIMAVDTLLQLAEVILALHQRRLALVVARPEHFECVPRPPRPSSSTPTADFQIQLTRLATVVPLSGFDHARRVTEAKVHRRGSQGVGAAGTGAGFFDYATVRYGGVVSEGEEEEEEGRGGSGGVIGGTVDGIYDEAEIRQHGTYIAPEALATHKSFGAAAVDVFSFGVTAYRSFAERMPHQNRAEDAQPAAKDLLAILHLHAKRTSTPLRDILPSLPPTLGEIIEKCLNADPDLRYGSIEALLYDLRQVRRICAGHVDDAVKDFVVGDVDRRSRFEFPILIRSNESAMLEKAYEQVKNTGKTTVAIVWGISGSGKSKLLENSFFGRDSSAECRIGWCKFDQHLTRPLSGLIQIFESLLTSTWSDPKEDLVQWRKDIMEQLREHAGIFLGLISKQWREVLLDMDDATSTTSHSHKERGILTAEDQIAELGKDFDWTSYVTSIRAHAGSLLQLFATKERPLIVVLDDIQWIEPTEKALWEDLMSHSTRKLANCLFLVAHRTETEDEMPPPIDLRKRPIMVQAKAASERDVEDLLKLALHIESVLDPSLSFLASFLTGQTRGNMFYLNGLMSELVRNGVLFFDFAAISWRVDTKSLDIYSRADIETFTRTVLSELPTEVTAILCILASLPSRGVPISLLAGLAHLSETKTQSLLNSAMAIGVVSSVDGLCSFQHDRIHAAALRLIPKEDEAAYHLRIGQALRLVPGSNDRLFCLTDHLILAHESLGDAAIPAEELCHIVLDAAHSASRSAAFQLSYAYLETAEGLLPPGAWKAPGLRVLPFRLARLTAEVGLALKDKLPWAVERMEIALQECSTLIERLEMYILLLRLHILAFNNAAMFETLGRALALAGYHYGPDGRGLESVTQLIDLVPRSVEEFKLQFARSSLRSPHLPVDERVTSLLIHLLAFAGPTIYSVVTENGMDYFDLGVALILSSPSVRIPPAAYCLFVASLVRTQDLQLEMARTYLLAADTIVYSNTTWEPSCVVVKTSLQYLFVETCNLISYESSWNHSLRYENWEIGGYVLGLDIFRIMFSSGSCQELLKKGNSGLKSLGSNLSAPSRIFTLSVLQAIENLVDPTGKSPEELRILEGSYLTHNDCHVVEAVPLFALNHASKALWIALMYGASADEVRPLAQRVAKFDGAGGGILLEIEALFLRSLVILLDSQGMSNADKALLRRTRQIYNAIPDLLEIQVRSRILAAAKITRQARFKLVPWTAALAELESTMDYLTGSHSLYFAGFIGILAARLVRDEIGSLRLASGLARDACHAWSKMGATGLIRYTQSEFAGVDFETAPLSTYQSQLKALPTPSFQTPGVESISGDSESVGTAPLTSLEVKVNLETILSTFLILASEKNNMALRLSLLRVVMQLQRCEYVALAMTDRSVDTTALNLVAAGHFDKIQTWDQLKLSEASALCPSSVMLLSFSTKTTLRLEESQANPVFRKDGFLAHKLPGLKSAVSHVLKVRGQICGVLLVASEVAPLQEISETPITLLATFALVALEAQQTTKNQERLIASRTLALSTAMKAQSAFTSSISHELRTPLFSIIGLLEVVQASQGVPEEQRENLRMIRTSAESLHRLIADVLDLAKLEAGGVVVANAPFNLRDVVEESIFTLAHIAQSKGLEIVLASDVTVDPPTLLGDSFRIRQSVLNLVGNAVKFTARGRIVVTYSVERRSSAYEIEIQVSDTGIGIRQEQIQKLFVAFSQGDSSGGTEGTGLGLSITRNLCRLMGGDAWCRSDPGRGSTFFLKIVCGVPATAHIEKAGRRISKTSREERMALIAAPDQLTTMVMASNLESYSVKCTTTHSRTLTALPPTPAPDFLFLDPEYLSLTPSHLATLRTLYPSALIYLLVSIADGASWASRLDLPHSAMVTKPVRASKLVECLAVRDGVGEGGEGKKEEEGVGSWKAKFPRKGFAAERPLKIAYVDDNKINVIVGLKILQKFGYTNIETANNGLQALELATAHDFDIIFMDLQMPVMDGHAAMKALKPMQRGGRPAVIALTANCDQATKDLCQAEGFTAFLNKPVNIAELTAVLTNAYNNKMGVSAGDGTPSLGVNGEDRFSEVVV